MDAPPDRAATLAGADEMWAATALEVAGRALLGERRALHWSVEVVEPGMLGLRTGRYRVALLQPEPDNPFLFLANLKRVLRGIYPATHAVVFGADAALREQLLELLREPAFSKLWLYLVSPDATWQSRPTRWMERRLTQALVRASEQTLQPRPWARADAEAHRERLLRARERARTEARELEDFRASFNTRRPRATLAIAATIGVVFALQALWGGVDLPPLLPWMGSLVPERVQAGEWWRYFACTFLHGGVLHVALNLLALWMIGRSLERLVGSTRFMLIYFAAGLAGSITSSLFVETQSVGASGAIWGLLGADAALAFYPRPLLPPVLVSVARRAAAANLTLNLAISFIPHVDLAAHVGGGVMGALVLLALAASGQLPAAGNPSPASSRLLAAMAGALTLVFATGLVMAQLAGRPWQFAAAPALVRVDLPGSPWSVTVPRSQSEHVRRGATWTEFGNVDVDPSVVVITCVPLADGSTPLDATGELAAIQRQFRQPREGFEEVMAPRVDAEAGRAGTHATARYRSSDNPDRVYERAIGILDGVMVKVDVFGWQALPATLDGLAVRVLGSLEPAQRATLSELESRPPVFHSGVAHPVRW